MLRLVSGKACDDSYLRAGHQVGNLDPSVVVVREVVRAVEDLALVGARDVFGSKGDCNGRRVEDCSFNIVVY